MIAGLTYEDRGIWDERTEARTRPVAAGSGIPDLNIPMVIDLDWDDDVQRYIEVSGLGYE